MCLDFQPLYPPTERARKLNTQLYIIFYCQIALSVLRFISLDYLNGIMELMLCLILWCGVKQMQFCQMLMYIILCMLFWVMSFIFIGGIIQHDQFSKLNNYENITRFIVYSIGLIFYIPAILLAFQGYKQYKAIQFESIGGGVMSMFRQQQQQQRRDSDANNNNSNNRNNNNNNNNNNQNRGGRGGGDGGYYAAQGQYQPPPYQDQNQNQNQNNNSNSGGGNRGGFQAFQGRGVRLG